MKYRGNSGLKKASAMVKWVRLGKSEEGR